MCISMRNSYNKGVQVVLQVYMEEGGCRGSEAGGEGEGGREGGKEEGKE